MATAAVSTPLKSHHSIFSTRTAGGRIPLTPSPRTRTANLNLDANPLSPFTPPRQSTDGLKPEQESLFNTNLTTRVSRSVSKTSVRDSPKSNIARSTNTPRGLELECSDFTLTGSGPAVKQTPSRSRRDASVRVRPSKTIIKTGYGAVDRFIPNRSASEAIITAGAVKLESGQRPKLNKSDGSTVLAGAASAFDIGGRASVNHIGSVLAGLGLDDDDDVPKYTKPAPDAVAYESSLATACGVSLHTRILAFKPAPPESSKPIDLRAQYNRPIKPSSTNSAQFRRRVLTAPERVLDAPGLVDDYYLNLLDWSSGNQVAIGLERNVYVWSAESGTVNSLLECNADTYVSSVKWSGDGAYVGVGLGTGEVQIWDVEEGSKLRSMLGHDTRVGVQGWNKHILSTWCSEWTRVQPRRTHCSTQDC